MKSAIFAASLASMAAAFPAWPKLTDGQMEYYRLGRRQANLAAAAGLTDQDVMQFALTLEWLEATFYQEGFQQFPAEQFAALGLTPEQINDVTSIAGTEFSHASFLQGALAQGGASPVQPCTYNFGFTDALSMVQTAVVLENVGVGAYLGAAQIVQDAGILTAAGSILTYEARHATMLRVAAGLVAVPQAFDAPLSPQEAFTLAAPFIASCPEGSNLGLTAFPFLTQVSPAPGTPVPINSLVQFSADNQASATHCAFKSGGIQPGGSFGGAIFVPFDQAAGCQVPSNIAGISYVQLVSSAPLDGQVTPESVIAGPTFLVVT